MVTSSFSVITDTPPRAESKLTSCNIYIELRIRRTLSSAFNSIAPQRNVSATYPKDFIVGWLCGASGASFKYSYIAHAKSNRKEKVHGKRAHNDDSGVLAARTHSFMQREYICSAYIYMSAYPHDNFFFMLVPVLFRIYKTQRRMMMVVWHTTASEFSGRAFMVIRYIYTRIHSTLLLYNNLLKDKCPEPTVEWRH